MSLPWPLAKPIFVLGSASVTPPTPTVENVEIALVTKRIGLTNLGATVAGAWTALELDTVEITQSWLNLAANQFTIDGVTDPGKYMFEWSAQLYDPTGS